jgi:hypothetical protein
MTLVRRAGWPPESRQAPYFGCAVRRTQALAIDARSDLENFLDWFIVLFMPTKDETISNITPKFLRDRLSAQVNALDPEALNSALPAMNALPDDGEVLLFAIIAALIANKPEHAERFLNRLRKYWSPAEIIDEILLAIIKAEQGHWAMASQKLQGYSLHALYRGVQTLPGSRELEKYFYSWVQRIKNAPYEQFTGQQVSLKRPAQQKPKAKEPPKKDLPAPDAASKPAGLDFPPLPKYEVRIPLSVEIADSRESQLAPRTSSSESDRKAFRLQTELAQLSLLQGFDELLCLPMLHGVETFWYQVETVRKVLKQFRGRVLLADEVGLGKTIEAGMVLKEYLLRGMAEKVLVLTPASLVGQWQEEMAAKFGVDFATSYDALLRGDPQAFWAQPRVIASIATARRAEHHEILATQNYDLVIVDEAHHLKNRATANWKLVNALQKRFLLLLSATPVQNSLLELYNLLTLLKPGIFKTEKDFRARYMTSGKPRVPANRDSMRDLMRDAMIRNTRSLVDVKLPPRHATTLHLDPREEEAACYRELTDLVQEQHAKASAQDRLALRHLLAAAGSTASGRREMCSFSTWRSGIRSKTRCCAFSTKRSICSNWSSVRSAKSWAN